MKLTIENRVLLEILRTVAPAVNSRSTQPVLSMILLKADKMVNGAGLVEAAATNLEVGIQKRFALDPIKTAFIEEGAVCIPAKLVIDFLSTLPPDELVHLDVNETSWTMTIKCGKTRTSIKCLNSEEFPPMPAYVETGATIDGRVLASAIQSVAFAASIDQCRPHLEGINFQRKGKELIMAATDGFRLAVNRLPVETPIAGTIPTQALRMVVPMGKADMIFISQGNGKIIFRGIDGWQITTSMIDGTYPDIDVIIPKSSKTKATVNRAQLVTAVRQARLIASESNRAVILSINGACKVHSEAEETGDTETEIESKLDGPEITIAFNSAYLLEALEAFNAGEVVLAMNDNRGPCKITAPDKQGLEQVLMPLNIK